MHLTHEGFVALLRDNVGPDVRIEDIKPDDRLTELGIDSLGFATLLWALEDRFKIQVDDQYFERLNAMTTVSDLIATFADLGHTIDL